MKPKVFVTRNIPESGITLLQKYCQVRVYPGDKVASREELLARNRQVELKGGTSK